MAAKYGQPDKRHMEKVIVAAVDPVGCFQLLTDAREGGVSREPLQRVQRRGAEPARFCRN